jgi:hypothetical protein
MDSYTHGSNRIDATKDVFCCISRNPSKEKSGLAHDSQILHGT